MNFFISNINGYYMADIYLKPFREKYGHEVDSDNEASQPSCSTMAQASDWINSSPDKPQTVCKRKQKKTAFGGSPKKKCLRRNKTEYFSKITQRYGSACACIYRR